MRRYLYARYHEILGEMYGNIAGWCLHKLAIHALYIDDEISFERVRTVLTAGVEAGWDEENPTRHVRADWRR